MDMDQPTRLILVRHGETDWNSGGRYQGHSDVGLSEAGRWQAARLRERFRGERIDAFYASDLHRAMETAAIIAEPHGKAVCPVPALREINFGYWEGLTHSQIAAIYPQELERWLFGAGDAVVPGGESFAQVRQRAWRALEEMVKAHRGQTILAVSHGGTIRAVLCAALNMVTESVWRLAQDNAAVNIIDFYPQLPVVVLLNDTSHLSANKSRPAQL